MAKYLMYKPASTAATKGATRYGNRYLALLSVWKGGAGFISRKIIATVPIEGLTVPPVILRERLEHRYYTPIMVKARSPKSIVGVTQSFFANM